MKKIIFLSLALVVLSCSFAFAARFSDVTGTKYDTAVTKLSELGVVDGFTDGTFKPLDNVTRAQLCKLLVEGLGLSKKTNAAPVFNDVDSTHWAYNYIKVALDNGVVQGYTDGSFKPNNNVKFSEMFTMVIRAMGRENYVSNRSNWPNSYIEYAQTTGLTSNVFYSAVADPANRGEVSIAIYNMIDQLGKLNVVSNGFVESVYGNNVKIDGVTYTIAPNSSAFETDTYAVFNNNGINNEVTLRKAYGVADLDANAQIINYVEGSKAGSQEVRYDGSSKYVDYYTSSNKSLYSDYAICSITVKPNSRNVLTVSNHKSYSSLSSVYFEAGDRVIIDSTNKIFLIFTGLKAGDTVKKGQYTSSDDYATIKYAWGAGQKVSGVSLPSDEVVEIGTTYKVKLPSKKGYTFYADEGKSFTVKKDITIYIYQDDDGYATITYKWGSNSKVSGVSLPKSQTVEVGDWFYYDLPSKNGYKFWANEENPFKVKGDYTITIYSDPDDDDDEGGYAGSNMPLIDRVTERELKQALEYALAELFNAEQATVTKVKFSHNDTDSVKFEATYDLFFDPVTEDDLDSYTAGSGVVDRDAWAVRKKSNVGYLVLGDGYYYAEHLATGW